VAHRQRADSTAMRTAIAYERRAFDTGNVEQVAHTADERNVSRNVFVDADVGIVVGVDLGAAWCDGAIRLRNSFVIGPFAVELVKEVYAGTPFRQVIHDVGTGFGRPYH